jgi:hypothetical protein
MRNSRHTLIELSGNQRFVLAYVPTGSLYDVNEGDEVTIKTDLQTKRGIITRAESFAAALPREFARSWVPIRPPLIWSSPHRSGALANALTPLATCCTDVTPAIHCYAKARCYRSFDEMSCLMPLAWRHPL